MSKYGHYSAIAADKVYDFGLWLLGILSNPRIVAVHNNYNKGYNIRSYKRGDPGVKNLYINPHQSTGSFLYTTNARLFAFAKEKAINVILQRITATDDGSYSIFAQRHHIDYVNIESMRGDAVNMRKLLAYVYTFYNKRNLMQECPMQGYHQRGHRGHVHYKRHHHNTTEHH